MVPSASPEVVVGLVFESVVWGVYFNLFLIALIWLWHRYKTAKHFLPLIFANSSLFALCTAHVALGFFYDQPAYDSSDVHGVEVYKPLGVDSLVTLCSLIGICMLLHRCWTLWNRSHLTIVPACACALAGFGKIEVGSRVAVRADTAMLVRASSLIIAGHALLVYSNLVVTIFIAWRASRPHSRLAAGHTSSFARPGPTSAERPSFMAIIEESGMIQLAAQVVLLVFVVENHPMKTIVAGVAVQVYGIAPALVALRIGSGSDSSSKVLDVASERLSMVDLEV